MSKDQIQKTSLKKKVAKSLLLNISIDKNEVHTYTYSIERRVHLNRNFC